MSARCLAGVFKVGEALLPQPPDGGRNAIDIAGLADRVTWPWAGNSALPAGSAEKLRISTRARKSAASRFSTNVATRRSPWPYVPG